MNGSGRPGQASWYRTSVASRPPTTSIVSAYMRYWMPITL